jgi:hypothetical protein
LGDEEGSKHRNLGAAREEELEIGESMELDGSAGQGSYAHICRPLFGYGLMGWQVTFLTLKLHVTPQVSSF